MKNKEFYANEIIEIAIHGESMGVNKNTLTPCACNSIDCSKCLVHVYNVDCCDSDKLLEWANAEHVDKYEHDEVVLWKNSKFDEWIPAHYAYYKDGCHQVYANGCSSLTAKDVTIAVDYIRKYDKELAWTRDYHLDCDCVTGSAILRKEQKNEQLQRV